jgi:hypothetical protein
MQEVLGCKKEGKKVFRFTSPLLWKMDKAVGKDGAHTMINQCPVGYVQSNTSYIYNIIDLHNYVENGSINILTLSFWAQRMIGFCGAERSRLREMDRERQKLQRDSDMGRMERNHG